MTKETKQRTFLINTEKFHPIILKHLEGREDILSFRQLQGEMAELHRSLVGYSGVANGFTVEAELLPIDQRRIPENGLGKFKISHAYAIKDKIVKDIIRKHLDSALEEIKNISLDFVLEEIEEIPMGGNLDKLLAAKKSLEERTSSSNDSSVEKNDTNVAGIVSSD